MKYSFLALAVISTNVLAVGVTNPDVTQENLKQTVCKPGWSSQVRPPVTWTNNLKRKLVPKGHQLSEYELDHIVPISIGGAPKDVNNLWIQPWDGRCNARDKDVIEWQVHQDLCSGKVSLKQAQQVFLNWSCK